MPRLRSPVESIKNTRPVWIHTISLGDVVAPEAYRVNPYGSGIFDRFYRAYQPWHDEDSRIGNPANY
jgi:hypothetical protein